MIGILTPYGRNETTAAALRLADLIVSVGHEARVIACGVRERNVHPYWDAKVYSSRRKQAFRAVGPCDSFVHFVCDSKILDVTTLVNAKAAQILVPNWTTLTPHADELVRRYTAVVCPTKACYTSLRHDLFKQTRPDPARMTWARWDAGIVGVPRAGVVVDGAVRACVYADYATIDYCGPTVLRLVEDVLSVHDKIQVTVLSCKSWAKHDRKTLVGFQRQYGSRFKALPVGSLVDQMAQFHKHDWVVIPSVRAAFGIAASRAVACGCPVIAHDIAPFNEIITNNHDGLLVPCEIKYGAVRAPLAAVGVGKWLSVLHRAFLDGDVLSRMQERVWDLNKPRAAFDVLWVKTLGLAG